MLKFCTHIDQHYLKIFWKTHNFFQDDQVTTQAGADQGNNRDGLTKDLGKDMIVFSYQSLW